MSTELSTVFVERSYLIEVTEKGFFGDVSMSIFNPTNQIINLPSTCSISSHTGKEKTK